MEIRELVSAWITPAANDWYRKQCQNPYGAFYLYYKESTDTEHGAVVIETEPLNDSWVLGCPERIQPFWTVQQVKNFAFDKAMGFPILKGDWTPDDTETNYKVWPQAKPSF